MLRVCMQFGAQGYAMDAGHAARIRYGIVLAPWGDFADPAVLAQLAVEAEGAGWDGIFLWDAMLHDPDDLPKADPWIALAAIALRTERLRLGTLVTPVASPPAVEAGPGSDDAGSPFGRQDDPRRRVGRSLGRGVPVVRRTRCRSSNPCQNAGRGPRDPRRALARGAVRVRGRVYRLHEMTFAPRPIQQPRVPIWVGGWWPNQAPFRRAARWDGVVPGRLDRPLSPEDVRELVHYVDAQRSASDPFDVVVAEATGDDRSAAKSESARSRRRGRHGGWRSAALNRRR